MLIPTLALLALLTSSPEAGADQQLPPIIQDPESTVLEDVVVDGRRLDQAIDDFVADIVAPPVNRGPARWHRRVCVGAINFRTEVAQAIVDQVSNVAAEAGLEVGEPGCRANVLIIGTEDGSSLAAGLVDRAPRAFRPLYSGAARSREALDRFVSTDAPVRWWHVSLPVGREDGRPAVRMPLDERYPVIRGEGRLRTATRNDLIKVFIIVDVSAARGVDVRRLGDYVGMVALAQIDPEADPSSYDTVLNLFDAPEVQRGLTAWDRSYLQAFYGAELNARAANQQGGEVSSSMYRDLRDAPPTDDAEDGSTADPTP
ncbi:hypothetical protein [Brevundimonas sp. AAP58]|uniref:hypothetical protein n=1 Tax=Brevundimonas sp. AAP58 TaxID=1523422 RepID=UPI0006B902E6|nr:hypothetical protein [Brevundimonas sp. AAP58]